MRIEKRILLLALIGLLTGGNSAMSGTETRTATLAGGCFWCIEAVYEELAGVGAVVSGYAGGEAGVADYRTVCSGETGHAEAVQLTYDPAKISYEEILTVFFSVHDPTTLNRQGADAGPQYRSAIFFHDEEQKAAAVALIRELEAEKVFPAPVVTTLEPMEAFFAAEKYHQGYYEQNKSQPYCRMVIAPKLDKFRKKFRDKLERGD